MLSGSGQISLIKSLPRTERRMVESMNLVADMQEILGTLSKKKTVTIASDGGLKGNQGTFGWLITKQLKVLLQGSGPVDSHPGSSSSTWCELWGYASALLTLTLLLRQGGCKPQCRLRWVVDSTAAISRVRKFIRWGNLKRGRQPHDIDVLSLIRKYYQELGKRVRICWVKAHKNWVNGFAFVGLKLTKTRTTGSSLENTPFLPNSTSRPIISQLSIDCMVGNGPALIWTVNMVKV